jgi:hypothetical protein
MKHVEVFRVNLNGWEEHLTFPPEYALRDDVTVLFNLQDYFWSCFIKHKNLSVQLLYQISKLKSKRMSKTGVTASHKHPLPFQRNLQNNNILHCGPIITQHISLHVWAPPGFFPGGGSPKILVTSKDM